MMPKRVFAIERSPLSRNVYSMILSRLEEVNVVQSKSWEDTGEIEKELEKADLVILSQSTVGDRKNQVLSLLCQLGKERPPCIILCHRGSKKNWNDYSKLDGMVVVERPFYPDDFLEAVKDLWEVA